MESPVEKKKNKLSTVGLWLGLASILFWEIGIIPLLAIVFSSIALYKVGEYHGDGRIKAIVGLVLGILYMISNAYQNGHL